MANVFGQAIVRQLARNSRLRGACRNDFRTIQKIDATCPANLVIILGREQLQIRSIRFAMSKCHFRFSQAEMDRIDAGQPANGARQRFGRRPAETASRFDPESSAENPKSDERTNGEPGGKKFRTCSQI